MVVGNEGESLTEKKRKKRTFIMDGAEGPMRIRLFLWRTELLYTGQSICGLKQLNGNGERRKEQPLLLKLPQEQVSLKGSQVTTKLGKT